MTRPLLKHYFSDVDELRDVTLKYIRLIFQKIAVEALSKGASHEDKLSNYVASCFYWVENFRSHSLVWLAFLHRCASQAPYRKLNSLAQVVGQERIADLLEAGRKSGDFEFNDALTSAKTIQTLINGGLLILATEDLPEPEPEPEPEAYKAHIETLCLRAVGRLKKRG